MNHSAAYKSRRLMRIVSFIKKTGKDSNYDHDDSIPPHPEDPQVGLVPPGPDSQHLDSASGLEIAG